MCLASFYQVYYCYLLRCLLLSLLVKLSMILCNLEMYTWKRTTYLVLSVMQQPAFIILRSCFVRACLIKSELRSRHYFFYVVALYVRAQSNQSLDRDNIFLLSCFVRTCSIKSELRLKLCACLLTLPENWNPELRSKLWIRSKLCACLLFTELCLDVSQLLRSRQFRKKQFYT